MKVLAAIATLVLALFIGQRHALGAIQLDLVFDSNNLDVGNTGTFSISGATTSANGASDYWITQGPAGPTQLMTDTGELFFKVVSVTNAPTLTYNGNTVTQSMTGSNFLTFAGLYGLPSNAAYIYGPDTSNPAYELFQIGNATTDAITGTFEIVTSSGLGTLTLSDLNTTFGGDASLQPNVHLSAAVVPEPASSALLAIGGAALLRRRW